MIQLLANVAAIAPDAVDAAIHVPAAGSRGAPALPRLSLRAKALLLLTGFAAYALGASALLLHQTTTLLRQTQVVSQLGSVEVVLATIRADVAQSYVRPLSTDAAANRATQIGKAYQALRGLAGEIRIHDARLADRLDQLGAAAVVAGNSGEAPGRPADMPERRNHELEEALAGFAREVHEEAETQQRRVDREGRAVTRVAIVITILGLVSGGALWGLFFTRLTRDLSSLEQQAKAIVNGLRGAPLAVTRGDEVGALMQSVNRMADDLERRESELQRQFAQDAHSERMALVGGVATGVLHEIGNPMSAIVSITAELGAAGTHPQGSDALVDLLREQVKRIAATIARLRRLTDSRSSQVQPLDLNAIVEAVCDLVRYERRFRNVSLELQLAPGLPAVLAVEDDLTQVLLAVLLELAAPASPSAGASRRVAIGTRAAAGGAEFVIVVDGLSPTDAVDGERVVPWREPWRELLERHGGRIETMRGDGCRNAVGWLPT